ncbi:type II toxin-antitoxin system RnlA family toxin [Bacillus paranthracis]|uniref:type II toxin-antitoxin system RnlA family toxin n=1 Tax=Bacillus paranthracis TaxID=2026186 RepID=UPI0021CFA8CD|nr:type II toxin-antitoxin system RnlA family toxin [Bacillus paranthracis]MCU4904554.1 type II toxin-antitoxin system RnlA family toxin [Bacillus paranthracis]
MAKEKNIFKGLNLDREKLPEWIREYSDDKFESYEMTQIEHISGTQHRCTITGDCKIVKIDFYYAGDGKTTIRPTGQNHDISFEVANYILGKLTYKQSDNSRSYSIRSLQEEVFSFLIEYLEDLDEVQRTHHDENERNKYSLYQYTSKIGDKITLKYFENKTLQIQGKPAFLYQEVACFLSGYFPFNEVIKNQSEFYSVNIRPEEIRQEMKELLPQAYNSLGENLKKILSGSLTLQKVDVPMEDYSPFVFPALKTLEGVIKDILLSEGIDFKLVREFGKLFERDRTGKYVYINADDAKIDSEVVRAALAALYNYYHRERHGLFHVANIDLTTRVIETKPQADRIISEVIRLIEKTYVDVMSVVAN